MTIENYNFRQPGRLASDLEQQLGGWLRDACALAHDKWSRELSFRPEMSLGGIKIARAADVLAALPEPAKYYRVGIDPDGVTTLLALPRTLALALVAGAQGEASPELPADRELTVVEDSLFDYLLHHLLLAVIRETWPAGDPLSVQVKKKEPLPKWARLFAVDENVIVCDFTIRGPFGEQGWQWILPQKGLFPLLARTGQTPGGQENIRPRLEAAVQTLPIEIAISLGSVRLPLDQVSRLRPGDVVIFDQKVSEPLSATVAGAAKLRGWPGRVGGQQAFQVEERMEA